MRDRIPLGVRRRVLGVLPKGAWPRIRAVLDGETPAQEALREARRRRHEQRHASGPGLVSVEHDGHLVVAREVDSFAGETVRRENLALTAELLERAGIEWVLLDDPPAGRSVVVVPAASRVRFREALRHCGADPSLHVADPGGDRIRSAAAGADAEGHAVVLFRLLAHGRRVLDAGVLGCEVQFWGATAAGQRDSGGDLLPEGTLVAPVRNRWVDHVRPREWAEARRGNDGHPRLPGTDGSHVEDVTFPIDVVYTWVDGEDPEWLARKAAARGGEVDGARHATAANESRYEDHDELRYSLRSLQMYASWVRHVYLVTDAQVPSWLDRDHPGITVVDHREIFTDTDDLPTFNSHAIEAQLQNIEGLSEQFLYLNDDVLLGRPVPPELFFTPTGQTRFFPSTAKLGLGPAEEDEAPVMTAAKNNRDLLRSRFGRTFTAKMKHVPHALRRSILQEMAAAFPQAYERTAAQRFRSPQDHAMVSSLHHWYAYVTGRAQPGAIRYFYTDINHPAAPRRLRSLRERRDVDALCLNDHARDEAGTAEGHRALRAYLEQAYPVPSCYER
ncbi:stealth conserved region 3 domain-containing protein [Janibacter corallicola]|uniref:stealth conserved region 3 domain-containing protein n=1 Tax=Janibacter corallicola TaxID=415212 RepID=UPI00083391FB|nr:stealth conserved region 3 domain-containing protein [Janibacter corallicola]